MHGINQDTLERNAAILDEVSIERIRQDNKWGVQDHPLRSDDIREIFWLKGQEHDWRKKCEELTYFGKCTWFNILMEEVFEAFAEDDPIRAREEFIQVAAVAASIVEWMDRTGYCKEKGDERAQA